MMGVVVLDIITGLEVLVGMVHERLDAFIGFRIIIDWLWRCCINLGWWHVAFGMLHEVIQAFLVYFLIFCFQSFLLPNIFFPLTFKVSWRHVRGLIIVGILRIVYISAELMQDEYLAKFLDDAFVEEPVHWSVEPEAIELVGYLCFTEVPDDLFIASIFRRLRYFLSYVFGWQPGGGEKRVLGIIEGEVGPCLDIFGVITVESRDVEHGLLGAELDLDGTGFEHVAVAKLG